MPFQPHGCVVCELARPEAAGKWSLLGVFGMAPSVRIAIANFNVPITVCFVYLGTPAFGAINARIRVLAPSGVDIAAAALPVVGEIPREKPLNMMTLQFTALAPGPGQYTVELIQDHQEPYRTTITLEHQIQPMQLN